MFMIEDSLKYSLRGENVLETYLIAGVVMIASILIIPLLFFLGYLLRIGEQSSQGSEDLAKFSDFKQLFVDGLKFFAVVISYLVLGSLLLSAAGSMYPDGAVVTLALALGIIVYLAFLLAIPMALIGVASEGTLKAAFRRESFEYILTRSYWVAAFSALMLSILGTVVLFIIGFVLSITVVGIVLIPFLWIAWSIYFYIFFFRVFGLAYSDITEN